jgi:putative transposase
MCAACRPAASTIWWRALGCGSRARRSAACVRRWTSTSRRSGAAPLEGRYPYLFLDAKVEKVRDGGRVVAKALVVAHGVHETGRREIPSIDVGEAETEAFWTDFLRGLVAPAWSACSSRSAMLMPGSRRRSPRCSAAPGSAARCTSSGTVSAIRARPARPVGGADPADLQRRLARRGARPALRGRRPPGRVAEQGGHAARRRRKLRSTNPLERFNKEIGRRTDVVGIFPDDAALIRLTGMLCIEQNDEWLVGRRYLSAGSMGRSSRSGPHHQDSAEVKELQPA